jgi:hypothetical protein
MGKLDEIRNKLESGTTPKQLIAKGYPRSSVYRENKKLKVIQSGTSASPVSDEIQELRRHKEIIKLEKEIAELEALKEKLPERVAALESGLEGLPGRISFLERQLNLTLDAVEHTFFELHGIAMSMQIDDYGALFSRKRTEQDRGLGEKKAGEFIGKYRL